MHPDPLNETRYGSVNETSVNRLYRSHYTSLVMFACNIIKDLPMAEDVVAEGFLKLWARRHKMRTHDALPAFLFMVIRNACLNHVRDQGRRSRIHQYLASQSPQAENQLEDRIHYAEIMAHLRKASLTLPPKMQEVFQLLYVEGLSVTEAARRLDIHVNTVCSHKSILLRRMKLILGKKQAIPWDGPL